MAFASTVLNCLVSRGQCCKRACSLTPEQTCKCHGCLVRRIVGPCNSDIGRRLPIVVMLLSRYVELTRGHATILLVTAKEDLGNIKKSDCRAL